MFSNVGNHNVTDDQQILLDKGLLLCSKAHVNHNLGIFYGEIPIRYTFPLMMFDIIMVVVITQTIRFLLKPLRQPRVISEILGGIIMGPSVLRNSERIRKYLFPTEADYMLKNIGLVGFMYFLFVSGIKTDLRLIRKAGRKQWIIALFSFFVPMICTISIAIPLRKTMNKELAKAPSIFGFSSLLSATAFPVIHPIIKELNLLSSEIGRLALSTALIMDVIGINAAVVYGATVEGSAVGIAVFWYMISLLLFMLSIFGGFRQAMFWIVRTTPQGKPIAQVYVIAILLGVMVVGFLADMLGIALLNGPMWLGLAVPDGPPLGAILVEKSETVMTNILMPLCFIFMGLITDVSSMSGNWSIIQPPFFMALAGFTAKLIATFMASLFLDIPPKESLALSLLMSLRGQLEILLLIHFVESKVIAVPSYSMMVVFIVVVTAVCTPLITTLYDPTRPYMVNKRRNIQHNPPNSELRIVACFPDEESVPGIINLLEVSSDSALSSPIRVYALHLIELIARATPVFIEHDNEVESEHTSYSEIHRALKIFQESRRQDIKIHHYTSITAKGTMYRDICELALSKKASLIMLPFDKELAAISTASEGVQRRVQPVNIDVLEHSPCSVAIFSDTGFSQKHILNVSMNSSHHHFIVLFLGGADSREALTYADRISVNPNVCLTVIRFLSHDEEGDDKMEKKLDDGLVTWFWVKNERNSRVVYREVVVRNGEETIAAIQNMTSNDCNLFIMGRKHGINPVILQGLSDWNENHELGVIGDYIASTDLGSRASLLVVQQQILRG